MKRVFFVSLISLLIGFILLTACSQEKQVQVTGKDYGKFIFTSFDSSGEIKMNTFTDEELSSFINSYKYTPYYRGYYYGGYYRKAFAKMSEPSLPSATAQASEERDYSQTNVQVAGIDEADIMKSDGDYIYTITGQIVYVIKAYPGEEAEVKSTIKFSEGYQPQGMFLEDDYLAVFGNFNNNNYFKEVNIRPRSGLTFFNIYDISDKSNPRLVKEFKFEGSYADARMHQGYVYFVVRSSPEVRPLYPGPIIIDGTVVKSIPAKNIYHYNIPYNSPEFVSVHSIKLSSNEQVDSVSVAVESSQNLYMSYKNLYISYTQYINEYDIRMDIIQDLLYDNLTEADKLLIERIKNTDPEILSEYEKKAKIQQIYESYMQFMTESERDDFEDKVDELYEKKMEEYEHLEFTIITKISANNGDVEVKETGKVPGYLINQFAMDEKDDNLRVATTLSARWNSKFDSKSSNNVYVLDSQMNIIGKLEGLAETEQIYSTRFIGDRLYMVTFRQVDPFFVIDLSDPVNPKELGKLKIPGFSKYLHPYDDDTIIGIGQEASYEGRIKGLKISLFDVSDVANPQEIAKFVTDERYAQSTALYEHKAFLFSREKNLLVIPAYNSGWEWEGGKGARYNGAFVFKITKDEITLRGLIDHSTGKDYWQPMVERSMYINELLYTKSPSLLRINKIEDLSSVKNITLEYGIANIQIY